MKYRTTLTAKAELLKPNSVEFRAVAASLRDRYGFDLKPQMDLLYVRSCLVSAGVSAGINANDDIFVRDEAWASRQTPVLKPMNWQHNDKDILGVMYTVQARDLDGNILDIHDSNTPDCDFDLWVEAAIFKLIHPQRADEIEQRSKAGKLFVSMEAWFDDYSYGLYNPNGQLDKVIARNKNTAFLDQHLRAAGGVGVYRDPESNQDMRIGRVLKDITFGGCGFVDNPANQRSVIESAGSMASVDRISNAESQIEILLQKVLETQKIVEDNIMNLNHTQANEGNLKPEVIASAVDSALDKREKAAAAEREHKALVARANDADKFEAELKAKSDELSKMQEVKQDELQALQEQINQYGLAVENLVKEHVAAGATGSTPAEIAAIDAASDGAAAFNAKLAWISKSMAALSERAVRAAELEAKLAEAEAVVREQDVRSLLGEVVSEEALAIFVSHAAKLNDEAYISWRDEKELMVIELTAGAKKEMPKEMMKKKENVKKEEKGCANVFEALLAKRRSESGMASPETPTDMGHLINHPGGEGVKSGVGADQLRTPRHKIAGSAGDNPAQQLEHAQVEGGVSLAGSQAGDDGEGVSPFRVLASMVINTSNVEETKVPAQKPGFDPVQQKGV